MRLDLFRVLTKARFSATLRMLLDNLASTGRSGKQAVSIAVDSILVVSALWCAYSLRHGELYSDFGNTWYFYIALPLATAAIFAALGIYRWVIRYSNDKLFRQLSKASCLSGVALLLLMFFFPAEGSNPRSLFLIYALILSAMTILVRLLWKKLFDVGTRGEPVAIYGAGTNGRHLVDIFNSNQSYFPAVFIDDDPNLASTTISGLKVLSGADSELRAKLDRLEVGHVVLAMPAISASAYEKKLRSIETMGLPALTIPSINELLSGDYSPGEVRDVSIQDILGRGEVAPDIELMARRVAGKSVLITGAGGSIGSELSRQVFSLNPKRLIILDNCEVNLYHITEELDLKIKRHASPTSMEFIHYLGSVTDVARIDQLFDQYEIDTVYHAAAYKHVPIVEAQPDQGVEINVFGTLNVLKAAVKHNASDFVLISTDKAVRPTNAMGATKRVAEMVLQAFSAGDYHTRISMVRFGNVLGSSGSVVPKFQKQIKEGGPITLTHPDVTRYFMTIPEAAQLVLQASAIAKGGDVFVLDMGEPVRIEQLAVTMVKLYGKKLERETKNPSDIRIVVEGLRPGEKMYEELFLTNSNHKTEVTKIFSAAESWLPWPDLQARLEMLSTSASMQDSVSVKSQLMKLAFFSEDSIEGDSLIDNNSKNFVKAISA